MPRSTDRRLVPPSNAVALGLQMRARIRPYDDVGDQRHTHFNKIMNFTLAKCTQLQRCGHC
jgi:hypothetical protein